MLPSNKSPKSDISIITDEPTKDDALDFNNYSQKLADIITNSTPRFAIGIFGEWGMGKTTLMKMIKGKLDNNDDILTVWFDSWKYEKEKYLAIVPLIRTIEIELEDKMLKLKDATESNKFISKIYNAWNLFRSPLKRTLTALESAAEITIKSPITGVDVKMPLSKAIDSYNAHGHVIVDDERRYFYRHQTERLADALNKINEKIPRPRVVVFIDDLDRCNAEKALEILESIKAFFDMQGFIYVIGMNSKSINSIIKKKFSGDPGVTGIDYMQKIVQLPFQIPAWKEKDISSYINTIISKSLKGFKLAQEFQNNKSLIVKAVELNPRQVKRFIKQNQSSVNQLMS